ncbi:MOSC domain-containing protein [Kitasatospora mediocidica]|uniref:MOSC domain-containing protein n=1 Tax=Kitasatospora mediocidica TaxID=58352 RepID=UPI00055FA066|nr:MOSC domain-containing protein [Kitasatospora mediocidica]
MTARARVRSIHRYPVKSMLGEELAEGDFTASGLAGDRAFAVLGVDGAVGSAKHPRKWGRLLSCRAESTATGAARVVLPGGAVLAAGAPELDQDLSVLLGRPVVLSDKPPEQGLLERQVPDYDGGLPEALAPSAVTDPTGASITSGRTAAGTFFDFGAVHLVTTGTLDRLRRRHPAGDLDPRRFRPNLVIDTGNTPGYPEDAWPGARLRIGGALFQVQVPTPRCVVPTLAHGDLPPDPTLMRTVAREHRVPVLTLGKLTCVGLYLTVLEPGTVRTGDPVTTAPR